MSAIDSRAESGLAAAAPPPNAEAIRDACISSETRKKYTGNINVIKRWIRNELAKVDANTGRFFDEFGDINLVEFTPAIFEDFVAYKRTIARSGTLSGYRSAIRNLYRVKRIALPVEYGEGMKVLFSGVKRMEAEQNQSSSSKTSGKQPLTYSLYQELCKSTLTRNDSGFSHLFLTSQWNLMCRSVSVQNLQTQHLSAIDDSVGAIFFKTKSNQEGSGPLDPRHLYANSFSPSTCWVTALGFYLACNPRMNPGKLFPGSDQKLRFSKALSHFLKQDGIAERYGTHSVRKGVGTFACGGSTGGPSMVSVCLRCGWSIGGVHDRYLRYEAAGDQFLGRVVAGLPVNESGFAVLPPHFRDKTDKAVNAGVRKVFPGLADEQNIKGVLQLCLASLVFYAQYFTAELPPNHPLLAAFIFTNTDALNELHENLEQGESQWMRPTGIPPHVELYKKLDQQQQSIEALPGMLEKRMECVLEKKGVAAGNITRALLREEINSLLVEARLYRQTPSEQTTPTSDASRRYFTWGGKFHLLPQDFDFPSIDPLGAWLLWWFGNKRLGYPPYKGILPDDLDSHKKRAMLSDSAMMMRHISNGIEATVGVPIPIPRDEAHAIALFKVGYKMLALKPSKRARRAEQIKLTTVLRLVREGSNTRARTLPFKTRKRKNCS